MNSFIFRLVPISIGYIPLPSVSVTLVDSRDLDEENHDRDEHGEDSECDDDENDDLNVTAEMALKDKVPDRHSDSQDSKLRMRFGCFGKNEDTSILVLPKTRSFAFVQKT